MTSPLLLFTGAKSCHAPDVEFHTSKWITIRKKYWRWRALFHLKKQIRGKDPFKYFWIQKWDGCLSKCINIFIELRNKAKLFLTRCKSDLADRAVNENWPCQLGFGTDIFQNLKKLYLKFQSFYKSMFKEYAKIRTFCPKY